MRKVIAGDDFHPNSGSSNNIFVYGTLKTGQVRSHQWPITPQQIRPAWTKGRLFDTGPFPALLAGEDRVAGQVWSFADDDLPRTFEVLDAIEGTNQPGEKNEYDRILAPVFIRGQLAPIQASLYRFARLELLPDFRYVEPELEYERERYSIWPIGCDWSQQGN